MQHLTSVIWSLDNKFVLSASDEMNIRIWKANASEKLGTVSLFLIKLKKHVLLVLIKR